MAQSEEIEINCLLTEAIFYNNRKDEDDSFLDKSIQCVSSADALIKKNIRDSFIELSYDTIINFAETAIIIPGKEKLSEFYIDLFFQRNQSKGQMFIRALLVKARLVALNGLSSMAKGEEIITVLQKSLGYVNEALEIIKNSDKTKYSFLIYNVSVCVYNIIRFMIKTNWSKYFTEVVKTLDQLFDDVDEPDFNWRCRYTWVLFQCLYDSDNKADANKMLDKLWDNTKKKGNCDFQEQLLKLRIHLCKETPAPLANIKKDIEANKEDERGLRFLLTLQMMKSGLVPEATIEKELTTLVNSMNVAVLSTDETVQIGKLSPMILERIAEAGRIALQFNLLTIAEQISAFMTRARQPVQVLQEFNRAELKIKKPGPQEDPKTGMKLSKLQIKKQEVDRRIEALKILEKAMLSVGSNKSAKQLDADMVQDGAVLIWNISLPFLNQAYRQHAYKALLIASEYMEKIQSNDHLLRTNLHLELAKIDLSEDGTFKAGEQIRKALKLDYSTPLAKLKNPMKDEEDKGLYQRPYQRYLTSLIEKINLRSDQNAEAKTVVEKVILDLENAMNQKQEHTKLDILQKSLASLIKYKEPEYQTDPSKDLVEEEINKEKILHVQKNLYQYKQKKLLGNDIAQLGFDWEQDEIAMKACEFVVADTWDVANSEEMVLAQAQCYFMMAQIIIDRLAEDNYAAAYQEAELLEIDEDEEGEGVKQEISAEEKESVLKKKQSFADFFIKGLELAESVGQSWLIFNGAIQIWNNFLPVLKDPTQDAKLFSAIPVLLKKFFESMKNSVGILEKKLIVDYEKETKLEIVSDVGLAYARLMEGKKEFDEVVRVCETLLSLPIGVHTRKLIFAVKARVGGSAKGAGGKAPDKGGAKAPAKGGAAGEQAGISTDQVLLDVVSQLETISNSPIGAANQELLKKCFETLKTWIAKSNDETELELHAELWVRLARLALREENVAMLKYSLRCVENSLSLLDPNTDISKIPSRRLRWYSLAECLYSENLLRMLNPETQEQKSQEQLLFHGLKHSVEGANKGLKAGINVLVLDSAKLVWNICAKLQDSALNRKAMIKPLFQTIFYLKSCKEKSEPDLVLLLSSLLFKAALENEEYHLGENVADMVFELIPKNMQKPIWEAKMIFMSKQGKNELQAISNMKEADASLQSKMWIRLARASNLVLKQYNAYSKAIEILKKESSQEIVEVYIEFAQWLLRNPDSQNGGVGGSNNGTATRDIEAGEKFPSSLSTVVQQLELAADVLIGIENDGEDAEDEEEKGSVVFSRLDKKSSLSKNSHSRSRASVSKQSSSRTGKSTKKTEHKKSTGSVGSRMSKTSSRAHSTTKSKQTKSIFTQREEDSNPESLNCAHFERLMRIHAMLSIISPKQETQIQFALDAKLFLIKIIELSFETFNTTLNIPPPQAAAPVVAAGTKQAPAPAAAVPQIDASQKCRLPQSNEEWIQLEFSPVFLEKVRTVEDYNFMGKFLFEKAEVTFTYISQLVKIFEDSGLHIHNIPLIVFLRFFSKEIIGSAQMGALFDLKYIKLLHLLGYHEQADKVAYPQVQKLSLTDQEKTYYLAKTESSKVTSTVNKDQLDISQQNMLQPKLIQVILPYQIWVWLGKELFFAGDLIHSKELFKEALLHAQVLQNKEDLGEIHLFLGSIFYLEGEYIESLANHMKSHRLIKNAQTMELSAIETVKTLKKLNKYEDIKNFLQKLIEVFTASRDKPTQCSNLLQIEQVLCTLYLLTAKIHLKLLRREYSEASEKESFKWLKCAREQFVKGGVKQGQIQILLVAFSKLYDWCERLNLCDMRDVNISFRLLSKIQQQLFEMDLHILNVLKYSVLIQKSSEGVASTPLAVFHCRNRVQLAQSFCQYGLIKTIKKKYDDVHNALVAHPNKNADNPEEEDDNHTIENLMNQKNELGGSQVHQESQKDLKLKEYISKLNKIIELELQPTSRRFESFERTTSILESIKTNLSPNSYEYIIASIEWSRSKRLLAEEKEQMADVWLPLPKPQVPEQQPVLTEEQLKLQGNTEQVPQAASLPQQTPQQSQAASQQPQQVPPVVAATVKEPAIDEEDVENYSPLFDLKSDSLQAVNTIYNKNYKSIDDSIKSKKAPSFMRKFCSEFLENIGTQGADKSFEFLARLQHSAYTEFCVNQVKQAMQGKHKFVTYQRLIKHVSDSSGYINQETVKQLTQGFKLWDNLFSTEEYVNIITKLLPGGSAYFLLQFSQDKRFLYFGFLRLSKDRRLEVKIKRKDLVLDDHNKLQQLKQRLSQIKISLVKSPIISEKDFSELVAEQEEEYQKILGELEEFFAGFTAEVDELINSSPELDKKAEEELLLQQQQNNDKGAKGGKKETKKETKAPPAKKGGAAGANKDEQILDYESPLTPSKTGVESVVLLLDISLFSLPIEQLSIFKSVPAVSKDFSLLQLAKRLKTIGFQPQLNNGFGITKDKLKYVSYSFKKDDPDNKFDGEPIILDTAKTVMTTCKWEGASSGNRITSVGEWQRYFSTGSMVLFYGNPGFMNVLSPKLFLDMNEISKVRSVTIIDKINVKKTIIEKFSSLDPEGEKIPLNESLMVSAVWLSILGVATVTATQWAVEPNLAPQLLQSFLTTLNEETYIAASLAKFKEPKTIYVDKNGVQVEAKKEDDKDPKKKNAKKEEKTQPDEELTEKIITMKRLATDNAVFIGVPVLRLS